MPAFCRGVEQLFNVEVGCLLYTSQSRLARAHAAQALCLGHCLRLGKALQRKHIVRTVPGVLFVILGRVQVCLLYTSRCV